MRRLNTVLIIVSCLAILWVLRPAAMSRTGEEGEAVHADHAAGTVVFDLIDDTPLPDIEALERDLGIDLEYSSDVSADEALLRAEVSDVAAIVAAAQGHPLVEVVEPVVEFEASGYPNDPMWDKQWNMEMIEVQPGWRSGGGKGVKVAIIDTGVTAVEDLQGIKMGPGKSFVPFTRKPLDDHGHGTHVAGTIAQATNNGKGVVGVAPNVEIMPYKALTSMGFGSSDWIAAAIDHAVDNGADVINMSLGGGHSAVLHKAAEDAAAKGVVVVIAAGNSGKEGVGCPAHGEGVIGVSAVGPDDTKAPYSSWGKGVEIAAPGGDKRKTNGGILQDTVNGKNGHQYAEFQGTSMATPHVAGAAAVLLGMGLDADSTMDTLFATAADRGEDGFDTVYGHGRLDLGAAVTRTLVRKNGLQFLVGGIMAFGLAVLSGVKKRVAVPMIAAASVTAGGLFFLPLLPLPPNAVVEFLSHDLLSLPAVVVGADWVHFPLWASALVPAVLAFMFGPSKHLGPLVAGLCVGFGASLLYGAAAGTIDVWWMGMGLDKAWLSLNGTVCLLAGMAVVGILKLEHQARA
ncbi:MAG: S8 family serine peptidase [Proteobacteria bacterium]|nr:S8 family serine peptidase [Pseudomonadota bacterium]MCP4917042.1 S8 family serine peptidase [Pseudomonadota bacterium]